MFVNRLISMSDMSSQMAYSSADPSFELLVCRVLRVRVVISVQKD